MGMVETVKIDLNALEAELKRRVTEYPPTPWGRKQEDSWDRQTNFIYLTSDWSAVLRLIEDMPAELQHYTVNRWFNFWSAMGIEAIFCTLPGVVAAQKKDRLVDFSIRGVKFDHKTTVFPQNCGLDLLEAIAQPERLAWWLYTNQSSEKRHHLANRLFVVLYDGRGEHWKLRAELSLIGTQVRHYVTKFAPEGLLKLQLESPGQVNEVLTDIIWIVA
jgi:hypothetical protein